MPYPNEHACRLLPPGQFQEGSFRRTTRNHNGKQYSVIMGRKTGETTMTEQAYRYDKDVWTSTTAGAHCRGHDGTFEPAAPANSSQQQQAVYSAYRFIQDSAYSIRTETHQGRNHLVVPVIMMIEGVHNGSHGPLLYLSEELGRFPDSWNGIPITISHPEEKGNMISANRPDIIDSRVVGRVYNTFFQDGKLKAEAWLDEEKMKQHSSVALAYIRQQRPLDVSIGVFTDEELINGDWNGESYVGIARNHRPDHLALLPGGTGACSWEDGCGVRINQGMEGGGKMEKSFGSHLIEEEGLYNLQKEVAMKGFFLSNIQVNGLPTNIGFKELIASLQGKLDRMDDDTKAHFLSEVFADYVIYEVNNRGNNVVPLGGNFFKRNYQILANGKIEFIGEPILVQKRVEYITMQKLVRTKGGVMTMENCEKIEFLVKNEFQEADREWLGTCDESVLDKLVSVVEKKTHEAPKVMTKEEAIQTLQEQLSDPNKFLGLLSVDMQEQMKHGLSLYKLEKQRIVDKILRNSKSFTADELNAKPIDELGKMASLITPTTDYSVLGGNYGVEQLDMLLPTGIEVIKGGENK